MKTRLQKSLLTALGALVVLWGCMEPVELTRLRRVEEPRVLAGTASAERFWRQADAIARGYKAPASERAQLAEMIAIGRRADHGEISLDEYRAHHARALARYEAQRKEARRMAARMWSRVFSDRAAHGPSRLARADGERASLGETRPICR